MKRMTRKAVSLAFAGMALGAISSQAGAIGIGSELSFDRTAPATEADAYSPVKNWADLSIDLGWMHTINWTVLHVTQAGDTRITMTDTSPAQVLTNTATNAVTGRTTTTTITTSGITSNPAFSMWSFAAPVDATVGDLMTSSGNSTLPVSPSATHYGTRKSDYNSDMGFNQVQGPAPDNNNAFLSGGGVDGFVGYANAGDTFVNGNGDAVGHGSAGSFYGVDAGGHKYAGLEIARLAAGDYLLAVGFNCINLTNCGNEVLSRRAVVTNTATGALISDTTTLNAPNDWTTARYDLTVSAVPVPAAVWLLGSALAGMGFVGRRGSAAKA